MNDEPFIVDTNLLVYAFDNSEPKKQEICRKLVAGIFNGISRGAVTNQVLAEFFQVITRKVDKPIAHEAAATIITAFVESANWIKIDYNSKTVAKAAGTSQGSHFWDALIAETAKENGIYKIHTENVKDFKGIKGIKALSIFK